MNMMEYIIIVLHLPQNYYKRLLFWNNLLTVATYVTFLESELFFFFVNLEVKLHRLRNTLASVFYNMVGLTRALGKNLLKHGKNMRGPHLDSNTRQSKHAAVNNFFKGLQIYGGSCSVELGQWFAGFCLLYPTSDWKTSHSAPHIFYQS